MCIGTRQVVFWVTQNVPSNSEPLAPVGKISLRSRGFLIRISIKFNAIKNHFYREKGISIPVPTRKSNLWISCNQQTNHEFNQRIWRTMVAKIGSGSSLYSALAYNHQKVKEGNAKVLLVNNMMEPPNGNFGIGI